ncbi:beta strand repeat-containing protein [Stappia indica]|uniref:beta strand repeat-containing protein n=1 Tax=Stappia indica TaxID=538381 RepID=UPI001CD77154|nr:filamentous hemagglutinin N-terminal domain-containing protein [Stappia indica]MCA1298105.1 filamentous hemagglutinin N-terminal domain-containing protein [Stappia indica]
MAHKTRTSGNLRTTNACRFRPNSGEAVSLAAFLLLTTALVPHAALAGEVLPTGGSFTNGNGTISRNGSRMDVHQSTGTGIVNWGGFSIGSGNQVHFDNGSGATLNRVTGNVPSRIDGSLTATGSVFLVNPAGVTVGSGGLVSTGGSFAASTQDVSDSDFLNGGSLTFSGNSGAEIVNAGTIRSAQGDIALIARRVENSGTLEAPNGTVGLAAGYEVLMKDSADADGLLSVALGGADTEAINSGTIAAANAEIRANGGNVYALAGNTDGVIKATGVTSSGGRIFLTAGSTGKVSVSGRLKARTVATHVPVPGTKPATEGGAITVTGGEIAVAGTLDASAETDGVNGGEIMIFAEDTARISGVLNARGGTGGEGGFVETSARKSVDFAGVRVDTSSAGGATGLWLIDPEDIIVDAAAAATIAGNLGSSNVTLQTTSTTAGGPVAGTPGGDGDITINSAITWSSANTLTLNAYNDIAINAAIDGQNGGLTLLAYGNGGSDYVGTISTGASGAVDVNTFVLSRGVWDQVGASLPSFAANNISIRSGTFIRAQGGDGTFSNPYQLFDVYGLQGIATNDARGSGSGDISLYYELASDIDASATSSWNGGAGFDPVFLSGSLDGKGHTIDGLYINRPSEDNVALISAWYDNYFTAGRDLEIKDLTLTNASVTGRTQTAILVGDTGAGNYHGHNMSNVTVSGTVETDHWGGGVVARYYGNINQSTMTNVHADVSITATGAGSAAGGLVGIMNEGLTISNSSSAGTVTGGRVGGLVGTTDDDSNRIENSYSTATVTASGLYNRYAGGLVSDSQDLTISNSYFAGQALGTNGASAGGLVGEADRNTVIENSFVTGLVAAEGYAGALVSEVRASSVSISDSAWDTGTTGQSDTIGFINIYTPTVTNTSGLTTAEMQGTLNFGAFSLSSGIWGTGSGLYPYFNWEHSTTPVAISGTVYNDAGTTTQSGTNVSALSGGNLIGSAASGANGYYYILASAGSLDPAGVLSYLDGESTKAATFNDTVTGTRVSNVDIWGNAFTVNTGSAAMTDVVAGLGTTIGATSDGDLDFLYNSAAVVRTDGNGNRLDFNVNAASDFNLDADLYAGDSLTVSTGGTFSVGRSNTILWALAGDLTVNGDIAWANSNLLNLYADTSNTSITVNGSVTAANGKLRVDRTGSATGVTSVVTGDIFVDRFRSDTNWTQIGGSLPGFHARDFSIDGGQFLRALGGDGSSGSPYRIADIYGLQGMGSSSLVGQSFELANDIDASGTAHWNGGAGFDPIGVYGTEFTGRLDGQGYSISDLMIARGSDYFVGLFGETSGGASISDLVLSGGSVTGDGSVGALVGAGTVAIDNVHVSTAVTGSSNAIGGLVGNFFDGAITGSSASGSVTGAGSSGAVGGLVGGTFNTSTIDQSYATGNVTVGGGLNQNFNVGGLVGENLGSITRSFATGDVVSGGNAAGGLVGYNQGSIADAYATGSVTAAAFAGGLIGEQSTSASVTHAYAIGSAVAGDGNQGGIAGYVSPGAGASFDGVFWNAETSGLVDGFGFSFDPVTGLTGVTSAQMTQLDTFSAAGFSIDDAGGTASTWRIYEGFTAPLLRGFLTDVTVTANDASKVYDGTVYSSGFTYTLSDPGAVLLGSLEGGSAGQAVNAGSYAIANGFYSDQFGYDITMIAGTLTITGGPGPGPTDPVAEPGQQVLERNRLQDVDGGEALETQFEACEPGIVFDETSVHPCNRSFGNWLSAAVE